MTGAVGDVAFFPLLLPLKACEHSERGMQQEIMHSSRQISSQDERQGKRLIVPDDAIELGPKFANSKVQELFLRWLSGPTVRYHYFFVQ